MGTTLIAALADETGKLFQPLAMVVDNPFLLDQFLAEIGTQSQAAGGDELLNAITAVIVFCQDLDALASQPSPSLQDIAATLEAAQKAFGAIRAVSDPGGPAALIKDLGLDISDLLFAIYLMRWRPVARQIASLLTLVDPADAQILQTDQFMGGETERVPYVLDRVHLERLPGLLRDPVGTLRTFYFNDLQTTADANAVADKLFPRILGLLRELGVPCRYGVNPADATLFGTAAPLVDHALIIYVADELAGAAAEAGVVLALSAADQGDLGLVATPFGSVQLQGTSGLWTLELDATADVDAVAYGRHGATLLASAATAEFDASFTATLAAPDSGPAFLIGSQDGSRIEVGGAKLSAQTTLSELKQTLNLSAHVLKAAIVLMPGDGDSFLQSVLPANGARAEFDLELAWSNTQGLKLSGAGGLDATLPVAVSVAGVVSVDSIHLGLAVDDSGVAAECSATASLSLGPVHVIVDRTGLLVSLTFPQQDANLGVLNAALEFKPPSGLGIAIDASAVTGGGYLGHFGDQYSGAMELAICDVAVKAYGLIETQLPSGAKGYSALVILSAEFTPGLALGFGFTLDGVGGLVGIDRTLSITNVETAIWSHHFDGLLFPSNPITAAPTLMTQIDSFFPAAEGRYLFGPLAKIGWGAGILEALLGLVIELPEPIKLLLFGTVNAQVPVLAPQLVLHIDFAGGIDFGQKLAFFDASLHNSSIERYPIAGDLAFRYGWGDDSVFALAIGGFNPGYQPPANFPALKRLSLLIAASNVQINAQAYLALTSNTLQFGARIEVTVGSSVNVHGFLGFDALVEWDPFAFEFDLTAGVDLRAGHSTIASVHLNGKVSGTSPWHVSGDASISLLFFDVSVHVDEQWGNTAAALPPPDPTQLVLAALQEPAAWSTAAIAGLSSPATMAPAPTDAGGALLLEPAGALRVTQRVAPLDQPITRLAGMPLGSPLTLSIDTLTVLGATDSTAATEEFAYAQFEDLTDDQKLSLPAFTRFTAGAEIGGTGIDLGQSARPRAVPTTLAYDTTIIDNTAPPLTGIRYVLAQDALTALHARIAPPPPPPPPTIRLDDQQFLVAGAADLQPHTTITSDGSKFGALSALQTYLTANPAARGTLQVVTAAETATGTP